MQLGLEGPASFCVFGLSFSRTTCIHVLALLCTQKIDVTTAFASYI